MKKILALLLILSGMPFHAAAQEKPVEAVATFSVLGDLTKQIGGDLVNVKTLVGPDSDTHTFRATPADSEALSRADVMVENGLGLDGWADRLASASRFKGRVALASQGVVARRAGSGGDEKAVDPHAWQNVANVRIYVRNIMDALSKARPAQAKFFQARASAYDEELRKLDEWVKAEISSVPVEKRKIITSHDAFGYFGAAYGVDFIAPQGISTEIEPTAFQVAKLVEQMKAEKVKRVFFENMASSKLIRQLAKDAGASAGEPVYSDALSKAGGPAATYVDMVRHNVALFKEAMALNGN
ncbi:MAG: zinc ABC transporter substrate-binding protein [Alphaproteobacteria bacterium]|nr:zinc ABC transporter substrate-binding protein [Alphaproteobacteria bacterium]